MRRMTPFQNILFVYGPPLQFMGKDGKNYNVTVVA